MARLTIPIAGGIAALAALVVAIFYFGWKQRSH